MGIKENKDLVRRFYEEILNTGTVAGLAEFISPECVEVSGRVRVVVGVEGMARHVTGVRDTYPDLHLTVERQIAEGDWVVTQITARGTHRGSWLGMKPTGRLLEFTVVNVDRVEHGRIVEHGGAANMLEPFLEAGAIKVVTS
jgi:predicted ester cyclase